MAVARVMQLLNRNKGKLFLLAAAATGVYVGGRFLMGKVSQLSDRRTATQHQVWRLKEHFESNRKTCNSTIISLLPTLKDALQAELNAEAITAELRTRPSNKIALWENLKTISFARVVVGVVSCSMLVAYLRVQLSVLGGAMFRDLHRPSGEGPGAPPEVQKKFLSHVQYFLQHGVMGVASNIKKAAEVVLADLSLKHQLAGQDMIQLIAQVGKMMVDSVGRGGGGGEEEEVSLGAYLVQYLTPRESLLQEEEESTNVTYLLSATRDVLDSDDFVAVLNGLINEGFAELHKGLSDVYHSAAQASSTLPLAKIIPLITDHSQVLFSQPFIQCLLENKGLQRLSENVYEAFSEGSLL